MYSHSQQAHSRNIQNDTPTAPTKQLPKNAYQQTATSVHQQASNTRRVPPTATTTDRNQPSSKSATTANFAKHQRDRQPTTTITTHYPAASTQPTIVPAISRPTHNTSKQPNRFRPKPTMVSATPSPSHHITKRRASSTIAPRIHRRQKQPSTGQHHRAPQHRMPIRPT